MTCATCGEMCEVVRHHFYGGIAPKSVDPGKEWRPVRQWFIDAPTYFKANADHTACEQPFCGAQCATAWFVDPERPV